ncbi:tyrosine-protein kinase SgK223 [Alligator mississippiensis]|uniref:Inactive tyrosine-protein kinase PRAG1 n=1 Tax=Alligator mississippiensis TaxID=8496 RepID=A0A151N385_ALLMI|nr:tyrosine-protein kinase SgK223 [Alligator mississippiensis]
MQRATSVNLEDLKMSACSNFVEHIWKPGSCKNCFCPKASHRLQTSLELGASNVPLHSRNGVRAKPEKIPSEDTYVTASPYTKPTIAVKPTMINSDVSDVWADVNMNADISQVSWQMSPGKHLFMKPGETQRTCLDNFGSSIMREPFVQDALNDCVQHPQGYSMVGLHNLENKKEIEEFVPPPPPPKKQSRHAMKMNKSNPELETVSNGSAESLGPSFRGIQVNFTAGSSDSLNSDTRSASDGGQSCEQSQSPTLSGNQGFSSAPFPEHNSEGGSHCALTEPPPLPQKKTLSVSSQVSSGSSLQLHSLLSNIDSKEGVYAKLGALYAESLRRLVTKCEDCFMRDQKNELRFSENNWSLFKLTCNKPCCISGDAIYYCATCSKDPSTTYAVKICKTQESKAAASYCSPSVPVHFNIQQDCGHFVASVPSSMLLSPEVVKGTSPDGPRPCHSASEHDCVVVITREVPHQTAASLVRDSTAYHKAKPELYERRICFLLLQLCNGLEHLKDHGIIHRDLCLENLLLVHCKSPTSCNKTKDEKHLPRLIISNFLKAKQKPGQVDSKIKKNQARLAPEIVSASQYKKFDEFQTGILIYELLHQPNPFEVRACLREQEYSQDDLPLLPNISIYSRGLQQLAHLLLEADPIKRIRITEAKRMLQCLLWGPRKDLIDQPLNHEEALHSALQNWIDMKRALLMMKFAERAVDTERSIELEDWLCCQYLASAEPVALFNTLKLLQLL